jgi:hypothetical protein
MISPAADLLHEKNVMMAAKDCGHRYILISIKRQDHLALARAA